MVSIERSELGPRDENTEKADDNPTNGHNARSTCIEAILKETVTGSVSAHSSFLARHMYVVIPVTTLLENKCSQYIAST